MLLSLTILVAALPAVVFGWRQDSVVGREPVDAIIREKVTRIAVDGAVNQTSRLRYVENSGVCGNTPSPEY
jgi:hypothetical protein